MIEFDGIVTYDSKKLLPDEPGIYFVLSGNEVKYIGRAVDINGRFRYSGHHHHRLIVEMHRPKVGWIICPPERLVELEAKYIDEYNPVLNTQIRPLKRGMKSKMISTLLPADERQMLVEAAAEREVGITKLIRNILRSWLADNGYIDT